MIEVRNTPTLFTDHRGTYVETWNSDAYPHIQWKQDCTSISHKNVLRGLHGDNRGCWKLITCLMGDIFVVVVDPITSRHECVTLRQSIPGVQVLVRPHCAIGHLVLSDQAVFHYKQSKLYDRDSQFTIKWDDPTYDIKWPITDPILSERDRVGPFDN